MKKIMVALLLGAVIWILFSPPILADGGNRIKNVQPFYTIQTDDYPWQEINSTNPAIPAARLSPPISASDHGSELGASASIAQRLTLSFDSIRLWLKMKLAKIGNRNGIAAGNTDIR